MSQELFNYLCDTFDVVSITSEQSEIKNIVAKEQAVIEPNSHIVYGFQDGNLVYFRAFQENELRLAENKFIELCDDKKCSPCGITRPNSIKIGI